MNTLQGLTVLLVNLLKVTLEVAMEFMTPDSVWTSENYWQIRFIQSIKQDRQKIVPMLIKQEKILRYEDIKNKQFRDHLQILLLVLSDFKRIDHLLFPLRSSEKRRKTLIMY